MVVKLVLFSDNADFTFYLVVIMLIRWAKVFLPLSILFLSACHTMNVKQCQNADWYQIGFQEGNAEEKQIAAHQKACSRFSIFPDMPAYNRGHREGYQAFVAEYCSAANGYRIGRDGDSYREICPKSMADVFLQNYHEGLHDFKIAYCTSSNGYRLGKKGNSYRDICPSHLEHEFLASYYQGYEIYKLNIEIKKLNKEANARKKELAELRREQLTDDTRYRMDSLLDDLDDIRHEQRVLMNSMLD